MVLGRIVDGLIFVSVEGYLHGQDDVGDMYLGEVLRCSMMIIASRPANSMIDRACC
jgi:hypothetical protein